MNRHILLLLPALLIVGLSPALAQRNLSSPEVAPTEPAVEVDPREVPPFPTPEVDDTIEPGLETMETMPEPNRRRGRGAPSQPPEVDIDKHDGEPE